MKHAHICCLANIKAADDKNKTLFYVTGLWLFLKITVISNKNITNIRSPNTSPNAINSDYKDP
jgi:hypothetical protein